MFFQNRHEAGRELASNLLHYQSESPYIFALPKGGVIVGSEIAKALKAPLDVIVVQEIGAPRQPGLYIGAIAPQGVRVLNTEVINLLGIPGLKIEELIQEEQALLERRIRDYRGYNPMPKLHQKTVIITDDGMTNRSAIIAAVQVIRKMSPQKIIMALPVCTSETAHGIYLDVDELVCAKVAPKFSLPTTWYPPHQRIGDHKAIELLHKMFPPLKMGAEQK